MVWCDGVRVSTRDVQQFDGDALAVGVFSDKGQLQGPAARAGRARWPACIAELRASGEVTGAADEVVLLHTLGKIEPTRVAIVGLGPRSRFTHGSRPPRRRPSPAARCAARGARNVGLALAWAEAGVNLAQAARAMTEGALLGLYRFDRYKAMANDRRCWRGADETEERHGKGADRIHHHPRARARASAARGGGARAHPGRGAPTSRATWATSRRTC